MDFKYVVRYDLVLDSGICDGSVVSEVIDRTLRDLKKQYNGSIKGVFKHITENTERVELL